MEDKARVPVAIKPLEWGCSPEWKAGEFVNEWFTYSLCGRYSVWCDPTIDLNLWHVSYPLPSDQPYEGTEHDTIEAAKAAAQSDYEARIRSALVPPAVPRDALPSGHVVLEQADMLDGRVSQTVRGRDGIEYERIVHGDEAYGEDE